MAITGPWVCLCNFIVQNDSKISNLDRELFYLLQENSGRINSWKIQKISRKVPNYSPSLPKQRKKKTILGFAKILTKKREKERFLGKKLQNYFSTLQFLRPWEKEEKKEKMKREEGQWKDRELVVRNGSSPGAWSMKGDNHPLSGGRRLEGEQLFLHEGIRRFGGRRTESNRSELLCSDVVLCSGNNRGHTVETTVMELIDARNWGFATWVVGGERVVAAVAFRFVSFRTPRTKHNCLSLSNVVQREKSNIQSGDSQRLCSKNEGIRAWSVFDAPEYQFRPPTPLFSFDNTLLPCLLSFLGVSLLCGQIQPGQGWISQS